jgi:DNA end-binding protein Ku
MAEVRSTRAQRRRRNDGETPHERPSPRERGGPRPIWNGHLTFGLVSMPVRVLSAIDESEHVSFRLLHRKDHAPIRYKKFCSREDVELPADEVVRGYEVGKGKYKLVEGEEIQEVQAELGEGEHTIDVLQFVEPASLDPLLFERPYYVVPNAGGDRAYALLREAMREAGRFAVARLYLRRPVLAAIMPHGDVLALEVMRPFDELRASARLALPAGKGSEAERRMARKLIDEMAAEWDPRAHPSRYRAILEKLLASRAPFTLEEGAGAPEARREGKVVDLMDALRRSLGTTEHRGKAGARRTRRKHSTPANRGAAQPRTHSAGGARTR